MFNDWDWDSKRTNEQEGRYVGFKSKLENKKLVVIELGAGLSIPSIRHISESYLLNSKVQTTLIRINPRDQQLSYTTELMLKGREDCCIRLEEGSLKGLQEINRELNEL
eukprot:TRINITY_DN14462_c0_g1_i1.p2 TRINITY_DN14462_c0_g1~~TRINITY_DN14462_c0_g1_i1.p2  ORF type:complete len:109 (-),score=22.01 TRINITY_DN14462_c0_g1_i1:786-1112(-)